MKTYLLSILICCGTITAALAATLDTAKIDQITGLKGKFNEKEGVYKVTFPRSDVKVVVDGRTMPPFMGLGTWAAFTPTKDGTMVMGDTVLFEDEVNAAMSAALDNVLTLLRSITISSSIIQRFISCTSKPKELSTNWLERLEKFTTLPNKFERQVRTPRNRSALRRCRTKVRLLLRR